MIRRVDTTLHLASSIDLAERFTGLFQREDRSIHAGYQCHPQHYTVCIDSFLIIIFSHVCDSSGGTFHSAPPLPLTSSTGKTVSHHFVSPFYLFRR